MSRVSGTARLILKLPAESVSTVLPVAIDLRDREDIGVQLPGSIIFPVICFCAPACNADRVKMRIAR